MISLQKILTRSLIKFISILHAILPRKSKWIKSNIGPKLWKCIVAFSRPCKSNITMKKAFKVYINIYVCKEHIKSYSKTEILRVTDAKLRNFDPKNGQITNCTAFHTQRNQKQEKSLSVTQWSVSQENAFENSKRLSPSMLLLS